MAGVKFNELLLADEILNCKRRDILWKSCYLIRRRMQCRREILKREGSVRFVKAFSVVRYGSL